MANNLAVNKLIGTNKCKSDKIYVLTSQLYLDFGKNLYKIGRHYGSVLKLLARYKTSVPNLKLLYFVDFDKAAEAEKEILNRLDEFRLQHDKCLEYNLHCDEENTGRKSEWVEVNFKIIDKVVDEVKALLRDKVTILDNSADMVMPVIPKVKTLVDKLPDSLIEATISLCCSNIKVTNVNKKEGYLWDEKSGCWIFFKSKEFLFHIVKMLRDHYLSDIEEQLKMLERSAFADSSYTTQVKKCIKIIDSSFDRCNTNLFVGLKDENFILNTPGWLLPIKGNNNEPLVLNLRSGDVSPRTNKHFFTTECPVVFDKDIGDGLFEELSSPLFKNKFDRYEFLMDIIYCLRGDTNRKVVINSGYGYGHVDLLITYFEKLIGPNFSFSDKKSQIKSKDSTRVIFVGSDIDKNINDLGERNFIFCGYYSTEKKSKYWFLNGSYDFVPDPKQDTSKIPTGEILKSSLLNGIIKVLKSPFNPNSANYSGLYYPFLTFLDEWKFGKKIKTESDPNFKIGDECEIGNEDWYYGWLYNGSLTDGKVSYKILYKYYSNWCLYNKTDPKSEIDLLKKIKFFIEWGKLDIIEYQCENESYFSPSDKYLHSKYPKTFLWRIMPV